MAMSSSTAEVLALDVDGMLMSMTVFFRADGLRSAEVFFFDADVGVVLPGVLDVEQEFSRH